MKSVNILLLLLCSFIPIGHAPSEEAKLLSAAPPDNFSFAGSWDCAGTFRGGKPHKAAFATTMMLDAKWIQLSERDIEPATGYVAEYLIGYDSQQHQLVEFDANNFGAATYTSREGWVNRVLTMTSPIVSQPSPDLKASYAANRFVYALTGSDTFTIDWQVSRTAALDWLPSDHLLCTRRTGHGG